MFKVKRDQALVLFKFVESMKFRFDPFKEESKSLREVWRRVTAKRFSGANPKANISIDMGRGRPFVLDVSFIDGSKVTLENPTDAKSLMTDVYLAAHKIEMTYIESGKPMPS